MDHWRRFAQMRGQNSYRDVRIFFFVSIFLNKIWQFRHENIIISDSRVSDIELNLKINVIAVWRGRSWKRDRFKIIVYLHCWFCTLLKDIYSAENSSVCIVVFVCVYLGLFRSEDPSAPAPPAQMSGVRPLNAHSSDILRRIQRLQRQKQTIFTFKIIVKKRYF